MSEPSLKPNLFQWLVGEQRRELAELRRQTAALV